LQCGAAKEAKTFSLEETGETLFTAFRKEWKKPKILAMTT
jgi:hypothetical protein